MYFYNFLLRKAHCVGRQTTQDAFCEPYRFSTYSNLVQVTKKEAEVIFLKDYFSKPSLSFQHFKTHLC